jgi:hypothetical protein
MSGVEGAECEDYDDGEAGVNPAFGRGLSASGISAGIRWRGLRSLSGQKELLNGNDEEPSAGRGDWRKFGSGYDWSAVPPDPSVGRHRRRFGRGL